MQFGKNRLGAGGDYEATQRGVVWLILIISPPIFLLSFRPRQLTLRSAGQSLRLHAGMRQSNQLCVLNVGSSAVTKASADLTYSDNWIGTA